MYMFSPIRSLGKQLGAEEWKSNLMAFSCDPVGALLWWGLARLSLFGVLAGCRYCMQVGIVSLFCLWNFCVYYVYEYLGS
jgi:hypothetical protein